MNQTTLTREQDIVEMRLELLCKARTLLGYYNFLEKVHFFYGF